MQNSPALNPSVDELALLTRAFAPRLLEGDLCDLLAYLNGREAHRFTGVYRFESGWVVSVALFDREALKTRTGADVKMKESYCWLAGLEGGYVIQDARIDPRLDGHAARDQVRSYIALVLRDRQNEPWGTLCHFDFAPRAASSEALARLEAFRPLIEEMLVRDSAACWLPEQPSGSKSPRRRRKLVQGLIEPVS